jgi:D-aspartate ligase
VAYGAVTTASPAERKPGLPGALIVGGAHGSLAIARSLGRRGIPVWFLTNSHPIAKYSRYTKRSFTWNGPDGDDATKFLLQLANDHRLDGWVLIAGGDAEFRFMSQQYAALSGIFRMTVPPWDTARWAHDKHLTYQRAASLGIDHPRCYHPRNRQALGDLDCSYPVILKPAVRDQQNAFTQAKAWRAENRATLLARYDEAAELVGEHAIVIQELVPGGGARQFSYAGVWESGSPVAWVVARRTRQYPVDFGYTSTFVETVEQCEIEEAATRFLRSINFSGMVEVEFKHDPRDGRYKLLDVNARAWTWNALGSIANVDFADVLWRLKMGERVEPIRGRAGVRWTHASRDLIAGFHEIIRGALTLTKLIQSWRDPMVFAAYAKDDPLPGFVDLPLLVSRVLTNRAPVFVRRASQACGVPAMLAQFRSFLA